MYSTFSPKAGEIEREWYVVDATGQTLGRLSAKVAHVLRGKHKPQFAPHMDTGDFIIVVNADKVAVSGRKEEDKIYYRHSGRPGALKQETVRHLRARRPAVIVERAVRGMLPKNRLGRQLFRKLKVYAGPEHPHQSQQPAPLEI